jgi:hypothetical protein
VFKFVYDYYLVVVPGNCPRTVKELGGRAIDVARERARLYCLTCAWTARLVAGEVGDFEVTFRVRRRRNRGEGKKAMTVNQARRLQRGDRLTITLPDGSELAATVGDNTARALSGRTQHGELFFIPWDEHQTARVLRRYRRARRGQHG